MLWGLVVGWMGVIFFFSSQNGEDSGELSGTLLEKILGALHIQVSDFPFFEFLLRKAAHASVYFVLAMLIVFALRQSRIFGIRAYALTMLISATYACTDEFHQYFVPGRVMSIKDVFIDSCGAFAAVIVFSIVYAIYLKFKEKERV